MSSTVGDRTPANFVSFEAFEHDQDGNMTKRTLASSSEEVSYEWTDFESRRRYEVRLKHVESDTNGRMQDARYDVDGLRSRKFASGALPQVKNGNSSVEYGVGISTSASRPGSGASAAPSISYVSGHMILGAEIDGTFVYHLGDALSSVRDVVDSSGNVIRSNEWDEYGNLISSSGSGQASPKTWVGGLSVNDDTADSKLYNMGHRNYSSGVLGRFISRDSIGHAGNLNLYAYPTNPVRFVDPSGLLKTGEDGELYFDERDSDATMDNLFSAKFGYLFTDERSYVQAWKNTSGDHRYDMDCHGLTFTRGKYWLNNDHIQTILDDDYLEVTNPKLVLPGDIAVFRNGKDIVHSATVLTVSEGTPWLYEISGLSTDIKIQKLGISSNLPYKFYRYKKSIWSNICPLPETPKK